MPDTVILRSYHPDRESLYNPASGPNLFDEVPSPSFACLCAELSRLAYASYDAGAPALHRALQPAALELLATFSVKGAQAFATRLPDRQVCIVFRGTEANDPTDLGTDADCRLETFERFPGRVHKGFADSFLLLLPKLEEFLRGAGGAADLVLTGHSLGAALATLAASVFPGCRLITFGSPRVGDAKFASKSLATQVERYVDCSDVVTEVPPEMVMGYAHVGQMRYIDREGVLHAGPAEPAYVSADRMAARIHYLTHYAYVSGNVGMRDLADHAPANYIRALL